MFYIVTNVLDTISKGWVDIEFEDSSKAKICYATKVRLIRRDLKYEYISILEGRYTDMRGKIGYKIPGDKNKLSYLTKNQISRKPTNLILDAKKSLLKIDSVGEFKIVSDKDILAKGRYYIKIPDYPHTDKISKEYLDENQGGSRFSETWFGIESKTLNVSDSYLHYGKFSKGCLTVLFKDKKNETKIWNKIYLYLMNSRFNNHLIGKLLVK